MTCCTAFVYGPSPWPPSWRRAGPWASTLTYYRWKRQLDRYGPEILRPRERRVPQMANQISVLVEQRVVAFALDHPGFRPAPIAAELAQPRWGAIRLSTNGCGGSCGATASALGPSAMAGGRLRGPTGA